MANVWSQFEKLLPKQKQFIGKVTAIDSTAKTSTIQLLSGESVSVKGVGSIGLTYLVKDGVILNEMPELTMYEVTLS